VPYTKPFNITNIEEKNASGSGALGQSPEVMPGKFWLYNGRNCCPEMRKG
jgi:hypothetical protein